MDDRFEVISHTADKGIRAYGDSVQELFENAAYGMFSLMADTSRYPPTELQKISVDAPDMESLLRMWLSELLYRFEVDRVLFVSFHIMSIADIHLEGTAQSAPFSPEIEWLGSAVKAVTHHGLYIHRTDERWEAQLIFDV